MTDNLRLKVKLSVIRVANFALNFPEHFNA